jgi:hypothetical protein
VTTQPKPWEEGQPEGGRKPKGWYPGMASPNPSGRPKGITDKKAKLTQRMLADADGIVSVLIAQALEGDTGAASIILARVLPALRNQTEKVQFPFDASAPIPRQIEAVLAAVAAGAVAPDVGQVIISSIKALADVRAVEELEARIITLEAKQA